MSHFPVHSKDTAPEGTQGVLDSVSQKFGFLPNLYGALANSPTALRAYTGVGEIFAKSGLAATEQQVVMLTVSRFNGCEYCVAAHSTGAAKMNISRDVISGLREGTPLPDAKLEAVRALTQTALEKQGWLTEQDLQDFFAAGFDSRHVLDILVGVALKTLSNYANHVMHTPLDEPFAANAWQISD